MKKLGLAVALVLAAFAIPASAIKPVLIPYCSAVTGTCTPGTIKACTDVCGSQLHCTCTSAHTWFCQQEC